nr:hypothetical protein [Glaciihabitans sp. INWT7]
MARPLIALSRVMWQGIWGPTGTPESGQDVVETVKVGQANGLSDFGLEGRESGDRA